MSRKIVAILRGITPEEVVDVASAIVEAGISIVEVPLNSPSAVSSIRNLALALSDKALIGAGTVLSVDQVDAVADAGGRIIVSPNCDLAVIQRGLDLSMSCMPGVFTATECFNAINAGITQLKLFPAQLLGPSGLQAFKAVLPPQIELFAVGGVSTSNFAEWVAAGISGFGIGTSLYQPGDSVADVSLRSLEIVKSYDAACAKAAG
jgi:2-dehydro-3-deoxyphosphogalactonate aldolase